MRARKKRTDARAVTAEEYVALARAAMSEDELLRDVLAEARRAGWLRAHFRPALTSKGWRTPVQGDGKGFLDLVLVRERVLFVELKREGENPTPEQEAWIAALRRAGADVRLWRPSDWDEIVETLA